MDYIRQRGYSFYGVLWFLIIGGICVSVVMKLSGPYFQYQSISTVAKSIIEEPETFTRSEDEIRTFINRRLVVNSTKLPSKDAVKIRKDGRKTIIEIDYRVETHFYKNIHLTLYFKDTYEAIDNREFIR